MQTARGFQNAGLERENKMISMNKFRLENVVRTPPGMTFGWRLLSVAFVVMFLTAGVLSVGFGLFTGSAASETQEIAGDTVPDGLSASDWDGIRSAYNANRPFSIAAIGQEAYLKPAAVGTTQSGDQFGFSVAVSGDTVVVGARNESSSTLGVNTTPNESAGFSGAAYVFIRTAGVWTQQAYLKPAAVGTTQGGDTFGQSVAVAGDTIVVGAPGEASSTTGVNSTANESAFASGAAYVFTRTAGVWTQQAYLKPAAVGTTQAGDAFGVSVAVAGDTGWSGQSLRTAARRA